MKRTRRSGFRGLRLALIAALAGGVLPLSCVTRVGDAVVDGTQNFVFSLLDPTLFIESLINGNSGGE